MFRLNPHPVTEDAQLLVHALLEADPERFGDDPEKELERLTSYTCPECGSANTTQPDDEGMVDCMECGIWFEPFHPRNRHALTGQRAGSLCQGCGKPFEGGAGGTLTLDPENASDFRWLCGPCHAQASNSRKWWKDSVKGRKEWTGGEWERIPESEDPETPEEIEAFAVKALEPEFTITSSFDGDTTWWDLNRNGERVAGGWSAEEMYERFLRDYPGQKLKNPPRIEREPKQNSPLWPVWQQQQEEMKRQREEYMREYERWRAQAGPKIGENIDPETPEEIEAYALQHGAPRRIRTSYSIVTPESAEQGDFAESGWEDEEGETIEVDDFDDEGTTVVDKAVQWLRDKGVSEASASFWHPGVWYTSYEENYRDGSTTERNYHLVNFTDAESEGIFNQIKPRR